MYILFDKLHVFPGTFIIKEERGYLLSFVQRIYFIVFTVPYSSVIPYWTALSPHEDQGMENHGGIYC